MASDAAPAKIHQRHNWDCGLACTAAALGLATGVASSASLEATYDVLLAEIEGTSIWTIELALMLHRRGLSPSFFSVLLGVDPAHAALPYYSSVLTVDGPRITDLFSSAATAGLHMVQRHVDLDEVCHRLSTRQSVYIMLVDLRKLTCKRCMLKSGMFNVSFAGHYVLLTGYSYAEDTFELMDPSGWAPARCYTSAEDLDTARQAEGTDEDLIEVPLKATLKLVPSTLTAAAAGMPTA